MSNKIQEKIDQFEELYGLPQIVGAIDGCHLEINTPPQNHEGYLRQTKLCEPLGKQYQVENFRFLFQQFVFIQIELK